MRVKIGPFEIFEITNPKANKDKRYLTRIAVGHAVIHIFWRGDGDPDPHDHQNDFWTFPFSSYVEEVYDPVFGLNVNLVRAWRLHYRPAEYTHRVIGKHAKRKGSQLLNTRKGAFVTFVWRGLKRRPWGFWVEPNEKGLRRFVPWREYLNVQSSVVGTFE